jgi:hypothetical protein
MAVWLFLGCILPQVTHATDIAPGNVSGVWNSSGNPYLINGDIRIAEGESLTIEPGTQVQFTGPFTLKILGNLNATGMAEDSISFTTSASNITWRGIRLDSLSALSDTARFSHCLITRMLNTSIRIINTSKVVFEDCRIFQNTQLYAGTFYMVNTNARIARNVIHNNTGSSRTWTAGIYLSDGSPLISGNTFRANFAPNGDSSLSLWKDDVLTSPLIYGNVFENHTNGFVTLHNFVTPTFDGNTFRNNQGSLTGTCIWINAAYAGYINFRNNVFFNNSGGDDGGCIKVNQSLVNFENNVFESNETTYSGGAIQITNESTVNITDCEFKFNHVGNSGSAVYVEDYSQLTMNRCFIHNNTSLSGAFYVGSHSEASITNCIFANNESSNVAGAAYIHQHCTPVFSNCLFANNKAETGGAFYLYWEGDPIFNNCIFWGNEDQNGLNTLAVQDYIWNYCNPSFSHCVVQGGESSFIMGTSTVQLYDQVIEDDPMFVEPTLSSGSALDASAANWKVWAESSPCINAGTGDPISLGLGDYDFAGNTRLSGGALDIGPYEGGFGFFLCDLNLDGMVNVDDMTIFLAAFGCNQVDCEPADLDNDGQVGISDMMIFLDGFE